MTIDQKLSSMKQTECPRCKSENEVESESIDTQDGRMRCPVCDFNYAVKDAELKQTDADPDNLDEPDVVSNTDEPLHEGQSKIEPTLDSEHDDDEFNIRFLKDEYDSQDYEPKFDLQENGDERESLEPDESVESVESVESDEADEVDEADPEHQSEPDALDQDEQLGSFINEPGEPYDPFESDAKTEIEGSEDDTPESDDWPSLEDDTPEPDNWPSLDGADPIEEKSPPSLIGETDDNSLINKNEASGNDKPTPTFLLVIARILSFLFWTAAAIGLTYLLFTQISDRLYPAYQNHPVVQDIRDKVCQFLPCGAREASKVEFEVVVSRMDIVSATTPQKHVSIFILNKAGEAQAYPKILLTLKQLGGGISAQRVVLPTEYFTSHDGILKPGETNSDLIRPLIKPNKLGKILIKLNNPPQDAVGFEVRVVQ